VEVCVNLYRSALEITLYRTMLNFQQGNLPQSPTHYWAVAGLEKSEIKVSSKHAAKIPGICNHGRRVGPDSCFLRKSSG